MGELVEFEKGGFQSPFVIMNAGVFPCNRQTDGMTSSTSIAVSFKRREMVILGTQYAGEMKKGVFTIMNYLMPLMPKRDLPPADRALPLHASANIGPDQVMYHFISGYTAKVAGTEEGVTEPQATFSACFGAPFLVWHPFVYAEMLAAKLEQVGASAYLVNTGWVGGPC